MQQKAPPTCLPWNISIAKGGMKTVPLCSMSVKDIDFLERFFLRPRIYPAGTPTKKIKEQIAPAWNGATCKGGRRSDANTVSVSTIAFDYDYPSWSPGKLHSHLKEVGLAHGIHTTLSHTSESPRYRLVLFLDRPVTSKELNGPGKRNLSRIKERFAKFRENAAIRIGYTEGLDASTKEMSRNWVCPARQPGVPYEGYLDATSPTLCVDDIMEELPEPGHKVHADPNGYTLRLETPIELAPDGDKTTVADLVEEATAAIELAKAQGREPRDDETKFKCKCPFQKDTSSYSAFLRVQKNGLPFLYCTAERHGHTRDGKTQIYCKTAKKKGPSPLSLEGRKVLLGEVPRGLIGYIENKLAYSAPQQVFYRRADNSWPIASPLKKEGIINILIGKMEGSMTLNHVQAMVSHILSRQIEGFACVSNSQAFIDEDGKRKLNLYGQPLLTATPGKHTRINAIMSILCGEDATAVEWLEHWSAALVQRPERRGMVAIVSISPEQGIGKTGYGRILREIVGHHNTVSISNKSMSDTANASFVTKLFVIADEVAMDGSDRSSVSSLKSYITDDTIPCRALYANSIEVKNRMTWWLTSNEQKPLLVEQNDRRFTVLKASRTSVQYRDMLADCYDKALGVYTQEFREEIEAFAYKLQSMVVDYDLIARPLATKARQELQALSMPPAEEFAQAIEEDGPSNIIAEFPPEHLNLAGFDLSQGVIPCRILFQAFRTWAKTLGKRAFISEKELRFIVKEIPGISIEKRRVGGGTTTVCYVGFPTREQREGNNVIHLTPDNY